MNKKSDFPLVFSIKTRSFFSGIFKKETEQMARNLAYVFIASLFAFMGFFFFYRIFLYLQSTPDIGSALIIRILSTGFLTFFVLLAVSNIITSISTLYSSPEVSYLFSNPISYKDIFLVKFVENIFFSSWAITLLGTPIIASYGVVIGAPFYFYIMLFLFFIPFIVIASSLGVIVALLGARFLSTSKLKKILAYALPVVFIAILIFLYLIRPQVMIINETEDLMEINRFLSNIEMLSNPIMPNDWMIRSLSSTVMKDYMDMLFYGGLLITTAFVLFNFTVWLAEKIYYESWTRSLESGGNRNRSNKLSKFLEKNIFLKLFPQHIRSMIVKDTLLFFRMPEQWAQLLILVILLFVYIVNLRNMPLNFENRFWSTMIAFLNFGFTGYVLATVSVRFVFPAISLEGYSFWTVGTAPISLKTIFWEKFWFSFIISLVCAETLMYISSSLLKVDTMIMVISLVGTLFMCISLTSMNIGLGAIYPYFHEKNPSKIASSAGALVAVIICLVYVGLTVTIIAYPTSLYLQSRWRRFAMPIEPIILSFLALLALNIVAITIPIRLGLNKLNKRDF